jgi:glycosyltransferase involved in cell wall biosynthesis
MRIAYIAAGAAGMYCGSCLHDNTLAAALLELGEDVLLVPTYTPLRTDEANVSIDRVFFGGINVYLQQKSSVFRHTPWWLDRVLDSPALLNLATRGAGSVDPTKLGDMTVSMLRGEQGNQRKEIEKLVHWLIHDVKPDIVHLSNALQLGMARLLRERCGPPVVCQLSGEDVFLEKLPPPHYDEARAQLRQRADDADAFVAINRYYADYMVEYLAIDRSRIHVIPHGLRLDGHAKPQPPAGPHLTNDESRGAKQSPTPPGVSDHVSSAKNRDATKPQVVGYFARICKDKGLHLLVAACELLAKRSDVPAFVLHAAGYLGANDREYLEKLESRASSGPLAGRFKYFGELDRNQKIAFLQSLDVMSVPTVYRESKGLPALEAMANAVPVVLPDHGSFSELIADTDGGVLHRPHDPADLAEKIAELLRDPARATELGCAGQQAVHDRYHAEAMAKHTLALYQRLASSAGGCGRTK